MRENTRKHIISVIGLMFFLVLAVGSSDESSVENEISNQSAKYRISAQQLYAEYKANEVAADQKYKGQILEVSGTVDNIGKDLMDTIYVTIKGAEYFGSVQCFFSDSHANQAALLKKGLPITVKGKCDGKMMNILLRGCSIQ